MESDGYPRNVKGNVRHSAVVIVIVVWNSAKIEMSKIRYDIKDKINQLPLSTPIYLLLTSQ